MQQVACVHFAVHLVGLVQVAGDPGGVAEDEDHDDGEQQHGHRHVAPVSARPHHLGPGPLRQIKHLNSHNSASIQSGLTKLYLTYL